MLKKLLSIFTLMGAFVLGYGQSMNPVDITCIDNPATTSDIEISWIDPGTPCGGPLLYYIVYASSSGPGGPYVPLDSVVTLNYTHTGGLVGGWHYYVEAVYDCPGWTPSPSDTVDNQPPARPVILSVSVNPGGGVEINWEPSTSMQTCFYVIYCDNFPGIDPFAVDTVYGQASNYALITGLPYDENLESITLTVSAHDCCGNNNSFVPDFHTTMRLNTNVNRCDGEVELDWNRYVNWQQGVQTYNVHLITNGGAETVVGSVDSSQQSFAYSGFNDFDTLCFRIEAVENISGVNSFSNRVCITPAIVQQPTDFYLTNVTVDGSNNIQFSWLIDTLAELEEYTYWYGSSATNLDDYGTDTVPNPLLYLDSAIDTVSDPSEGSVYYQIQATNECDSTYLSTIGRSIFLEGELTNYYENSLDWNPLQIEHATVTGYRVIRDYGPGPTAIATVPDGTTAYVDDVSDINNQNGVYCYRIEATYALNLPNGYSASLTSLSNEVCIAHRAVVYIPNAFVPNGVNNEFKPVLSFTDVSTYDMHIFNRWGIEVFHSSNPANGWDGTFKNQDAPAGGYAYVINFTALDGTPVSRSGILMLIR